MKPYQQIAIAECGEPLVPIPAVFSLVQPHSYMQLGAPYGHKSPFYVRQGVCERLLLAQTYLQKHRPGWRMQIFDAYRPIAVQQFMVDYTFAQAARSQGLDPIQLTATQRENILSQVYQFWAVPSPDPATPPPHSTGAAVDLTLVNADEQMIDMGSPIDELSPRSYPNHFAQSSDRQEQEFHAHRQLLFHCMTAAGFAQHPNEWWHFSYGDQMWVWQTQPVHSPAAISCYGSV
ncbi:M15 family metallopeptidase [Pantanalinema sp. GBBB05]|uniref:M15 family metallopeptidase n=1 Tax=Pantanalinema sp. GBBB05 TaxID=2604139 RepID=UPI001DFA9BC9|nr:D-alanyl-D-alanine dipeptidase [Pantanalinema sp. GBBB05]